MASKKIKELKKMPKPRAEDKLHGKSNDLKEYIGEFVYGALDGSVTTFAVVAGSAGANLDISVVMILGFANLIADGFSMSVGNYFSSKAEIDNYNKHKAIEYWEVEHLPEKEREEVEEIYAEKGFSGELLEKVVDTITADKDRWVDLMMKEELLMQKETRSPLSTALVTFLSFGSVGFIPLLSYVFAYSGNLGKEYLFELSCIFTSIAFIIIGLFKSYVTNTSKIRGIIETLALGGIAALVAYFVGDVLEKLIR